MLAPHSVYLDRHRIPILFDASDPEQAELLRAFEASFGAGYAVVEGLDPPRYLCLTVLPGGASKMAAS